MKRSITVGGSVGAGVLLVLAMLTTVVCAQTIKSNEIRTNIFQQIKEKIKNNDWKPGDILNIKLLKDGTWFPGLLIIMSVWNLILLFYLFLSVFL